MDKRFVRAQRVAKIRFFVLSWRTADDHGPRCEYGLRITHFEWLLRKTILDAPTYDAITVMNETAALANAAYPTNVTVTALLQDQL